VDEWLATVNAMEDRDLRLRPHVRALLHVYENQGLRLTVPWAPYPPGSNIPDEEWRAAFGPDMGAEQRFSVIEVLLDLQLVHYFIAMFRIYLGLTPLGAETARVIQAKLSGGLSAHIGLSPLASRAERSESGVIFISHSHQDNAFCSRLNGTLRDAGFQTWFDLNNLMPGDSLVEKIDYGLRNSDFVVIVHSAHSASSKWVQREYRSAITMETEGLIKKVTVIRLDETELPPLLMEKRWLRFNDESYQRQSVDLVSSLQLGK
jgi:hypothetical protein